MQLPEDTPSLPKLPFIIGDGLLLLAAVFIASRSDSPLGADALLAISGCVGLGAILAIIPFITDYARRQDEALEHREQSLARLSRETAAAAEQISIAADSLPDLSRQATQVTKLVDQLPKLIQEKIHLLKEALAEANDAEIENLRQELNALRTAETEKLESTIEKIDQTINRLESLLARWETLPAEAEAAAKEIQSALKSISKAKSASVSRKPAETIAEPEEEPEAATAVAPATPALAALPGPAPESPSEPTVAPATTKNAAEVTHQATPPPEAKSAEIVELLDEPEVDPPAAPKPLPRRKAPPPIDDNPDLFETDAPDTESVELTAAPSADGATRLIVTSYIGIGNKLYLRGDGPGLHPDQGVPLQFVSIGKWRWETDNAEAPVKIRLFKNDQIECSSLGEITLQPAHQHEIAASF